MRKSLNWGVLYCNEFFFVFAGYGLAFWQGIHMYARGEIEAPGKIITYVVYLTLTSLETIADVTQSNLRCPCRRTICHSSGPSDAGHC